MIPQNVLSSTVESGSFVAPRNLRSKTDLLLDYEQGGTALGDASNGLQVQVWTGTVDGSGNVTLTPAVGAPVLVLTVANIVNFGFTFDQNMRVFIAYELADTSAHFYWFDTNLNAFTTTDLDPGSKNLRCSLDDKRPLEGSTSDIVLSYLRGNALYFRQQRDRYAIEYLLTSALSPALALTQVGLSSVNRFQFELQP